jgi:molecular chaperone DnaK
VTIKVFQGEREMAADNKLLGQFDLVGIPPARRGVPQIEVTFDIDANGIVHVTAKDKGTGKEQQIRIQASGGLAQSDIDQMVRDAEQFAEEDKKRREAAEARNNAESLVHATERQLEENGDKIDSSLKSEIEAAIAEARTAIDSGDVEQMNAKTQALTEKAMRMGQAIYEKEQAGAASPGGAGGAGAAEAGSEDVVDAEFSEVDDGKR